MLWSFISLGEKILSLGGHVSFEWPRHCSGWARRELMEFISKNSLFVADVDGCAVGMCNSHGQPLLKQWRFVCSNDRLATSLSHLRCRHDPEHIHGKICGSETQATEIYPVSLCRTFLIALFPDRHSVPAMPCVLARPPLTRTGSMKSTSQILLSHICPLRPLALWRGNPPPLCQGRGAGVTRQKPSL